ncbi:hypothetical protein [Sinosporangium siamense]|uniref:Transglycosylase SLT domain-containing protein n=1 Tax=Sinosporangium siamense TaxID=1367973 RepID=A0A919RIL0_9ACTN|nr:hypothetical protein [Sinosporangium siamense]GII92529.1 hypothetical protein Ssi02_27600 [Sinosporangium siamense]
MLKYAKEIADAAKRFGVNKYALTATMLYENQFTHFEVKYGKAVWLASFLANAATLKPQNASVGVSQLEIYRVKQLMNDRDLKKHFTAKERSMSTVQIYNRLTQDPEYSIKMAAARMTYVKREFGLDDWMATIAYCGCASSNRANFRRWVASGYQSAFAPSKEAQKRYNKMFAKNGISGRAFEYWNCVDNKCWWLT